MLRDGQPSLVGLLFDSPADLLFGSDDSTGSSSGFKSLAKKIKKKKKSKKSKAKVAKDKTSGSKAGKENQAGADLLSDLGNLEGVLGDPQAVYQDAWNQLYGDDPLFEDDDGDDDDVGVEGDDDDDEDLVDGLGAGVLGLGFRARGGGAAEGGPEREDVEIETVDEDEDEDEDDIDEEAGDLDGGEDHEEKGGGSALGLKVDFDLQGAQEQGGQGRKKASVAGLGPPTPVIGAGSGVTWTDLLR